MIAQSPVSTIRDAIAVDPKAGLPLEKILCTPATKDKVDGETVYGLTDGPLPAPVSVLFTPAADQKGRDHVNASPLHPDIDVTDVDGKADEILTQTLSDQIDAAGDTDNPLGLPIKVLETNPVMDTMAVIYSGDGGWRDLDEEVGGALQKQGTDRRRCAALFLERKAATGSGKRPWPHHRHLSQTMEGPQRRIDRLFLRCRHHSCNLQSSAGTREIPRRAALPAGFVDGSGFRNFRSGLAWRGRRRQGAGKTVDDIAKIDPKLVQCVYGTEEEDEDPCPGLKAKGVETIAIEGGHHFDEDYEALAKRIVTSLKTRLPK